MRFEVPEDVRTFLRSVAELNQQLRSLSEELAQYFEPMVVRWQHFVKTAAPIASAVMSEFEKWNIASEVLGRAGWLPHYTTPFDIIAECGEDIEAVRDRVLDYYRSNWEDVRFEMESRISDYKVDAEAKATLREALDAHECGLYRCVCRVLFPELERVFRTAMFENKMKSGNYKAFIKTLVDDDDRNIGDFTPRGLYELYIFQRLTMALREKHPAENNECIYGPFQDIVSEQDRKRLEQDPVPNRHAAMHGYVVYSSQQNSLNAIFMADYIWGVV